MSIETVTFLDAVNEVSAGNAKIPQAEFLASGSLAIVDQGRSLVAGFTNALNSAVDTQPPLIVFGDHTRAIKFVDFPFAMGADGVKVLQVREGMDPKFVYHFLRARPVPNVGYSRHFKFLKELKVPKPPIAEQRRVAAILDRADAIRTKRRQILDHLEMLENSIFHKIFRSANQWAFASIGDLGRVSTGRTPPTGADGMFGGSIPFVTPGDLGSGIPVVRTVTEQGATASRLVRAGSTLVCCIGATIGKAGVATEPSAFNQQINAIEWGNAINDAYGYAAIRNLKPVIVARGASTTLPLLPKGRFVELQIPVPPLAEQKAFESRIVQNQIQRAAVAGALAADDELFASLQSRAFRGEL